MARKLRWTDVHDIAIELEERHPDIDNVNLRFTDLHRWVLELPDFEDEPGRSNEKILEAIQAAWMASRIFSLERLGSSSKSGNSITQRCRSVNRRLTLSTSAWRSSSSIAIS